MSGTRKVYETVVYDPSRGTEEAKQAERRAIAKERAKILQSLVNNPEDPEDSEDTEGN